MKTKKVQNKTANKRASGRKVNASKKTKEWLKNFNATPLSKETEERIKAMVQIVLQERNEK
jgi:hypothetical protein